ncbi:MAG: alpha/beta hydrolase-fold protein [Cyclobacteriaceae bacterium]|nr:MAG: alpha/beta hydrolase-fold protein [Cyclobacteriaceae bacterium]
MRFFLCVSIWFVAIVLHAQDYSHLQTTLTSLSSADSTTRENTWQELIKSNQIPLTLADSVLFLYRGEAKTVAWMGDFNGWGYDKEFKNQGTQIPGSDIWYLKTSFPKDARLDYKILINGTDWIVDPNNPNQQWSGVGGGSPNSELRMPEWKADPIMIPRENIARGTLEKDILFNSKTLGYQVTYSIYYPAHYNQDTVYPVLYVTDGYEYLHERLGNMKVILDNLIADERIKPLVVIFIDHREPVNRSNNRRMMELAMNSRYLNFIADEFIAEIEKQHTISKARADRAILGSSMGGLTAAYFAFSRPEVFGMAGIQSPAFWFKPDIYSLCDNPENPPVKVFMTTGTIKDAEEGARKMKAILEKNTCTYQYFETNQGHSWGNFRDSIDDILLYFFPAGS